MLRTRTLTVAVMFAATMSLHGCLSSDDSTAGVDDASTEELAIESVALQEMGEYTDLDPRFYATDESDLPESAPISTVRWRRELVSFDKTIEITIHEPGDEPATADVTLTGESAGLLHLWAWENDDVLKITKDFADVGTRRLVLQKIRDRAHPHRGWKLVAMSGVEISSPRTTRQIRRVRVQAGRVDETFTNVTDLVRVGNLLHLPNESEVVVTVETADATDAVFLHIRHERRRVELENNGDGTFTGRYRIGAGRGPRHAVIDVLSHGTLYDDEAAYDNVAWGYTYLIGDVDPEL